MTDSEKVTTYIQKHEKWLDELSTLREVFNDTELLEEVKWGCPTYTLNGKIVAGFGAFKNHYAIWFHQGVFLKDTHKMLLNAQEGKTKALRQWRFEEGDSIPAKLVYSYIVESIQNTLAGKELKPQRQKGVTLPPILKEAFKKQPFLEKAFKDLSPGKQREYAEHIGSAKRETTQEKRLNTSIPPILKGKGLYDKYKNC